MPMGPSARSIAIETWAKETTKQSFAWKNQEAPSDDEITKIYRDFITKNPGSVADGYVNWKGVIKAVLEYASTAVDSVERVSIEDPTIPPSLLPPA